MKPSSAPKIVAHRGASHDAPENTLAAFRLAWEQGADGVEGDFYLTTDNQIVCIHDKDTKRTAGEKRIVESSTLQELRLLEYGAWKDAAFAGEPIPTLDEVIATVPDGKTMVIELKSTLRIIPKLVETLKRHRDKPIEWLVIAFDAPTVAELKKQMPDLKVHWLTSFKRSTAVSAYRPSAPDIATIVKQSKADGVGMQGNRDVIDADFVAGLKGGGCNEFHVWTIDDGRDAQFFDELGAFGITTNVPAVIGPALRGTAE
ncbi:glycerophosphodiester phosphodiesterase [Rubripirellula reticaptiva]|nr:glycerophosphodiester phosphodiesterase [Rubripirellula reticaptiva]